MIGEILQLKVADVFGLEPRRTWPAQIDEALATLSGCYGLPVPALVRQMTSHFELLREFAGYLTIDESYFLRHGEQFAPLVDKVRAHIEEAGQDRMLIWSVGCARGEEPYSAAIVLAEQLGTRALQSVDILATDLNPRAITTAREGIFRVWSFRDAPQWLTARYFARTHDGGYRIRTDIAKAVRFELAAVHERLPEMPPKSVDVILFRNVGIYLHGRALEGIYDQFARLLRPGGLLLTAPADPAPPRDLFDRHEDEAAAGTFVRAERRDQSATAPCTLAEPQPLCVDTPVHTPARRDPVVPAAATRPDTLEEEIERATALIRASPLAASGYLSRGQLYLSALRAEEAVHDLRSALFLDGANPVARFWYATALQRAGQPTKAMSQIARLARYLGAIEHGQLLSDGQTTAGQLLSAIRFMEASLR